MRSIPPSAVTNLSITESGNSCRLPRTWHVYYYVIRPTLAKALIEIDRCCISDAPWKVGIQRLTTVISDFLSFELGPKRYSFFGYADGGSSTRDSGVSRSAIRL